MKRILKKVGLVLAIIIGVIVISFVAASDTISKVQVEKSIYIDIPKEELWQITAIDFGGIGKWDAGVNLSEGRGEGINGSTVRERACYVSVGGIDKIVERLLEYDAENFRFKYTGVEGMPSMLKEGTNEWIHEEKGNGTKLTMLANMELQGLMGMIMSGTMEKFVSVRLGEALEELKVYAETGKPHQRKIEALEKYELEQSN